MEQSSWLDRTVVRARRTPRPGYACTVTDSVDLFLR
jgi:hypothetical protein